MPHCAGRCAHNGRCPSERFETSVVCERYSIALYTLGRWQLEEFPPPSPARRVVLEPGLGSPPPAEVAFDLLLDRRVDMDAARPCEPWVQAIRTPPVGNNSLCLSKWLSRSIVRGKPH